MPDLASSSTNFIDLNNPTSNALLAGSGAVGVLGNIATNDFLNRKINEFKDWDAKTKDVWHTNPYKSKFTGKWLQVSPEDADKILSVYTDNAAKLAQEKIGPFRSGELIGSIRLLPKNIKEKLTGYKELSPELKGSYDHYKIFSDPNSSKNFLNTHMLETGRYHGAESIQNIRRDIYDNKLSEEVKKIIEAPTSMVEKYESLGKLKDKSGLEYFEKHILGEGHEHPGIAKLVGGGITGKIDPKTGKLTQEVVTPGFSKNYSSIISKALRSTKGINKMLLGGKAAAGALGLFGLGNNLGEYLTKKSSSILTDGEDLAEAMGGGALTAFGLDKLTNDIKKGLNKKPNYNIGFNYGHLAGIGDGHKAPADNLRRVLERYIESLPEGHKLKGYTLRDANGDVIKNELGFAKRKGGLNFIDMASRDYGVAPGVGENFNVIYNTGLGASIPHPYEQHGNKDYGLPTAEKLRGAASSVRNYLTDTPAWGVGGFLPRTGPTWAPNIPNLDIPYIARDGGGLKTLKLRGEPYNADDVKSIGYGRIPKSIELLHHTPFYQGSLLNMAPDIVGTPFINPDVLDSIEKYNTKEKMLGRIEELLNDKSLNPATKKKVADVLEGVRSGKRLVTISGSGRGDYVGNRTAHLLDSLDRLGVNNTIVMPLAGGYTGSKDLSEAQKAKLIDSIELADKAKGRVKSVGRLPNELYTLLQRASDINMATSGMMGISEAANFGNLQYLPDNWHDTAFKGPNKAGKWQHEAWKDILLGNSASPEARAALEGKLGHSPNLQDWNLGSIREFPKQHRDVFKQIASYDGAIRPGVRQYLRNAGISDASIDLNPQKFNTDEIAELLLDRNKGKLAELTEKAQQAASKNRAKIKGGQKELIKDLIATVKKNNTPKVKLRPVLLHGGLSGLGVVGMFDGLRKALNPENYKSIGNLDFNLAKSAATLIDPLLHDDDHISTTNSFIRGGATDAGTVGGGLLGVKLGDKINNLTDIGIKNIPTRISIAEKVLNNRLAGVKKVLGHNRSLPEKITLPSPKNVKLALPAHIAKLVGGLLGAGAGGSLAFNTADNVLSRGKDVDSGRRMDKKISGIIASDTQSTSIPDNITITHKFKFFDDPKPGEKGMWDSISDKTKELFNKITN